MGIYRHHKGLLYQVLGLAHDANADEFTLKGLLDKGHEPVEAFPEGRTVVVYFGLQLGGAHLGPRLAIRTAKDFTAWVALGGKAHTPEPEFGQDRVLARREGWRPRFEYLGPELTRDML